MKRFGPRILLPATALAVLSVSVAWAQPPGTLPAGRPFEVIDDRFKGIDAKVADLDVAVGRLRQDLLDLVEVVDVLEKLRQCVRVFEGELGGLPGPHVIFSRCNVHVRSGNLATDAPVNGLGNLVLGYNEGSCNLDPDAPPPDADPVNPPNPLFRRPCLTDAECGPAGTCDFDGRTGSHNVIVGHQHTYQSFGGIVGGRHNNLEADHVSVLGGLFNRATSAFSAVGGGRGGQANGFASTVGGGRDNDATGEYGTVTGGASNHAMGEGASVSGGSDNVAMGDHASVTGGESNTAEGAHAVVVGGGGPTLQVGAAGHAGNVARGDHSAILGGQLNSTGLSVGLGRAATVSGGFNNNASGPAATVSGGQANEARGPASAISGGEAALLTGQSDWQAGALFQDD